MASPSRATLLVAAWWCCVVGFWLCGAGWLTQRLGHLQASVSEMGMIARVQHQELEGLWTLSERLREQRRERSEARCGSASASTARTMGGGDAFGVPRRSFSRSSAPSPAPRRSSHAFAQTPPRGKDIRSN